MLYKYVTPKRLDIIKDLTIRFTQYDVLNDPFECRFVLNPIPEEREAAEADRNNAEWAEVEVWLALRIGQLGMLCLSQVFNNLPMWAHYAANHKGLVIGFEEQHDFFNNEAYYIEPAYGEKRILDLKGFGTLCKVDYLRERTAIDRGGKIPFDSFFQKHLDWGYEQEVRIFRNLKEGNRTPGTENYLFDLPPDLIRRVIIGAQASQNLEKRVLNAICRRTDLSHVQVDRARFHHRDFNIVCETLHTPEGDA